MPNLQGMWQKELRAKKRTKETITRSFFQVITVGVFFVVQHVTPKY